MHTRKKLIGLGKLMRLDKPIGTLLLLWPTLSAFFILKSGSPTFELILIFCVGTFLMRSAGCIINDYYDKDFDGRVKRTRSRPLVTGKVKPNEALVLFFVLISIVLVFACVTFRILLLALIILASVHFKI